MSARMRREMPLKRNEMSAGSRFLLASGLPDTDAVDDSLGTLKNLLLDYEVHEDLAELSYQMDEHYEDIKTLARESACCLVLMTSLLVRLSSYRQSTHVANYDEAYSAETLQNLVPLADAMNELTESNAETRKVLEEIEKTLSDREAGIQSDRWNYHWRIANILLPETFAHASLIRDRKPTLSDTARSLVEGKQSTSGLPEYMKQIHRIHQRLFERRQKVVGTLTELREHNRGLECIKQANTVEIEMTSYLGDERLTAEAEEALMIALTGPWLSFREKDEDDMNKPFAMHDEASELKDEHSIVLRIIEETEKSTGSTATLQAALDYARSDTCKWMLHAEFSTLHA